MRANAVNTVRPNSSRNSCNEPSSTMHASKSRASYSPRPSAVTELIHIVGGSLRLARGSAAGAVAGSKSISERSLRRQAGSSASR